MEFTLLRLDSVILLLVVILVAVAASVVTLVLATARRRRADSNDPLTTSSRIKPIRLSNGIAAGLFVGLTAFGILALAVLMSFRKTGESATEATLNNNPGMTANHRSQLEVTNTRQVTMVPPKTEPKPVTVVAEAKSDDGVTTDKPDPKDETAIPASTANVGSKPKLELPNWINASRVEDGDATLLVLSSRQFATIDEAKAEVLLAAKNVVTADFHKYEPAGAEWRVPIEMVQAHAVRQEYIEKQDRDFGRFTAPMYRVHLQLRLSPRLHDKFREPWQAYVVERRLWGLGSVFGLLTLLTATMTSYLRLDALTAGAYRRRLKLAAVSLIAAGGLVVWKILPIV